MPGSSSHERNLNAICSLSVTNTHSGDNPTELVPCYSAGAMTTIIAAEVLAPSPWRTMWFSPRVTMRRLVDADVRPSWTPVVALAALSSALLNMQLDDTGALSASRSVMPVVIGVLQLLFGVLVGPFLLAFIGGWFGGEADPTEIREAIAWSYVPIAVCSALWIPLLLVGGTRVFGRELGPESGVHWITLPMIVTITASYIWSLPLFVGALAEVQRFSIGKAILCLIILAIPTLLLSAIG